MAEEPNERIRKISRKGRTGQTRRKTSRFYDVVIASFNASKNGNVDELKLVLSSNSFQSEDECQLLMNSKDKEGNTLILICIHGAASSKQPDPYNFYLECLKFLISAGVNVNSQDHLSRTALHWSVLYGRLDFFDALLIAGGNLTILDSSGLSPLHLAIGIKSERLRDKFIGYICASPSNEILEAVDGHGRNPLFLALTINTLRTFESLLIARANPDCLGPDGRKIIIHAIEKGQGRFTELLLKHGASLASKDPDGFSVIHLAACQENPESILILTETLNKTLLNVKDHLGRTPLMYACLMGYDKNVELLLAQKIWVLDQDDEGKTALHHTINNTHCGCADLLCKESRKIVHICDKEGQTPAHDAVITGNLTILNCLLKYGCDIYSKDLGGRSLIHWVAAYGTFKCFERLLEFNPPLEENDNHGATPLHYGCQQDKDEKVNTARLEVIKTLLVKGAKLTVTDKEGRRPIHWASTSGNAAAIKCLIENDDDVNAETSQEKMTPLHVCALQGHENIVKYLLKQDGIKINAQDQQKCTPLFYACSAGHYSVAEILLQLGADPNVCNDIGESPSHRAAMFGSVKCLRILSKFGASLDKTNDQKDTPLHDAASAGKQDVVKFLIENGCHLTVRNLTGATPLHYSVAEGHMKISELLLQNGACSNALVTTNETDFVTPLDIALGNSDHGHIQLLQSFGAKTGHCVVDNSALVIQHQWKVFKRRFSAVDSTYRSNLSDSISYHDRVEFSPTKHDVRRKDSNSVVLEEQCFATTKDKDLHYDAEEHHQTTPHISAYNENGNQLEKDQFVIEAPKFDPEKLIELKQSVAERVKSSEAECKRTIDLMNKAEDLRKRLEGISKETGDISKSKEFKSVLSYHKRISATRSSKTVCDLPRLPSR